LSPSTSATLKERNAPLVPILKVTTSSPPLASSTNSLRQIQQTPTGENLFSFPTAFLAHLLPSMPHTEGTKDGLGTTKTGSFRAILGRDGTEAWSFRVKSHDNMMEWWNNLRMLCSKYLIASECVERTGPVEEQISIRRGDGVGQRRGGSYW